VRRRLRSCSRLLDERVEAAQLDEREHDVVEAAGQAAHEECDEVHERASLKVQPDAADQRDEDEVVDPVVLSRRGLWESAGRGCLEAEMQTLSPPGAPRSRRRRRGDRREA